MSDISPATGASGVTGTAATQPTTETRSTSAISSDFDTFILMLTTQLENQDPLNPLDSAEFAVQLATFSGVEQQVRTNELLEGLTEPIGAEGLADYASWVGMQAGFTGPVRYQGDPVQIEAVPSAFAAHAQLEVIDSDGQVVQRVPIPTEPGTATWNGTQFDGSFAPDGDYALDVVSYNDQWDEIARNRPDIYHDVREARLGANGPQLLLSNGTEVGVDDVISLRNPPSP
ncbi:MAG: flagellar hook capping FlgD N-terminal domain-containing protein [Pseudomonadota bacterium]